MCGSVARFDIDDLALDLLLDPYHDFLSCVTCFVSVESTLRAGDCAMRVPHVCPTGHRRFCG